MKNLGTLDNKFILIFKRSSAGMRSSKRIQYTKLKYIQRIPLEQIRFYSLGRGAQNDRGRTRRLRPRGARKPSVCSPTRVFDPRLFTNQRFALRLGSLPLACSQIKDLLSDSGLRPSLARLKGRRKTPPPAVHPQKVYRLAWMRESLSAHPAPVPLFVHFADLRVGRGTRTTLAEAG